MIAAQIQTLEDLSGALGFAPQHLFWLAGNSDALYKEFDIPKRTGGVRRISTPIAELKGVQRTILQRVLQLHAVSDANFAYVKGKSAVAAARRLAGEKSLFKLDIREFFPTITARRVFGLYRSFGFPNPTAYLLTSLTTYRGSLCQGTPTSPYIANLICRGMDTQLSGLASSWGLEYIRYSDDLFFYRNRIFNWSKFEGVVTRIVVQNGFHLNANKSRFYRAGKDRLTLGLETGQRQIRLPRATRRLHRAAFHKASMSPRWAADNLPQLNGMLSWHRAVHGKDDTASAYGRVLQIATSIKHHDPYST
ncbi:MAG: RNA-directed DNA polymerase [Xanthobacteraceae bacterium]|nr:RNA-directed DNA polymerase [Xanthobacteraceae bacterium]